MNIKKLFKLSADLVCTIDTYGHFVDISDAATAILGYTPKEMQGKSYTQFMVTADLDAMKKMTAKTIGSTGRILFENCFLHKNLKLVPLKWSALWDSEEQLIYCIGKNDKLSGETELIKKSLKESNLRYQYVSKATSDAIWDWDIINETLYWGDGFTTVFGYDLLTVPRGINSWTDNIHPEDAEKIVTTINDTLKSKENNWKEEYRYLKADGTFADVVDRGFVIRNDAGLAIRMVGAMHDISDRKKNLTEMKQVTEDLFKRNRELHEFGYIVSHNLRSPVANILGITTLMEMEKNVPNSFSDCIKNLKTAVSSLNEVIVDLSKILDSRDSANGLIMEHFDLKEIVDHIKVDLAPSIMSSRAEIKISKSPVLICSHKAYIYSILFNLISNSLKYTEHDHPLINIEIFQDKEILQIIFSDNGLGIDLKCHGEELFKPYKRFHSNIAGKGLGLFLVKSHVEALNGHITVDSKPNKGLSYTILLPEGKLALELC